ncbi:MAG: hypothetical protein EAZ24_12565 [Burkholderiales bacterium]|nr:MAG: hypothetical protein EAZ24_12565 [Burkholderiales bacterium]TAG81469.1 MAG: hypothetical protein EAZ21_05970 [Betaproteobacteria bacterium]
MREFLSWLSAVCLRQSKKVALPRVPDVVKTPVASSAHVSEQTLGTILASSSDDYNPEYLDVASTQLQKGLETHRQIQIRTE